MCFFLRENSKRSGTSFCGHGCVYGHLCGPDDRVCVMMEDNGLKNPFTTDFIKWCCILCCIRILDFLFCV